jgi:hypothetical protein
LKLRIKRLGAKLTTAEDYIKLLGPLCYRPNWKLFDPTEEFYSKLLSGEDSDLYHASKALADHIGIPPLRSVSYEWGLLMPSTVAGRIHIISTVGSRIQIPLFYVGKPLPLGAILAHELSHQLLAIHGIWCEDEIENEQLTDAASIIVGLGKVVLNGTVTELADATGETQLLGYIDPSLRVDLYARVNFLHSVSAGAATEYLTSAAIGLFRRDQ